MIMNYERRWELLTHYAKQTNNQDLLKVMERIARDVLTEEQQRQDRFESYRPKRSADEPHDAGCQITRYGEGHACTCKSNMTRRAQQVENAGKHGDMEFRNTLGSIEAHNFDKAHQSVSNERGS